MKVKKNPDSMPFIPQLILKGWMCLLVGVLQLGLAACATGGSMVFHSFSFDTRKESPDAVVLDYQYGSSGQFGTYANKERIQLGESFSQHAIGGVMPRGDFLYVKWRIKGAGQIYEDKVDLKSRLPADIEGLEIHFAIKGPQLYVYLIWPYDAKHEYPPGDLKSFGKVKQVRLYPDQPKYNH